MTDHHPTTPEDEHQDVLDDAALTDDMPDEPGDYVLSTRRPCPLAARLVAAAKPLERPRPPTTGRRASGRSGADAPEARALSVLITSSKS
ncbi:hypothetical protein [Streptomyces chilikensis]|uniref:Uncharacterized protein n=1 Tax=Streptomyces chilikensis TaxID=1194079 RepID=A0ABV3EJ73_9ACTN